MKRGPNFIAFLTLALTGISLTAFVLLLPSNLDQIISWAEKNPLLAPLILILWRTLAIIIPPLPGGVVSFALLPAFGWFWSFIFATTGMLLGTSIAFFIARRYREPLISRFVPLQELSQWERKLSDKTEFLGFLVLRFTTGPVMDFISYLAGLSKLSYRKFFLATAISLLPDILLFYLGDELYRTVYKENPYWTLTTLAMFLIVAYVLYKSRFFQKKMGV